VAAIISCTTIPFAVTRPGSVTGAVSRTNPAVTGAVSRTNPAVTGAVARTVAVASENQKIICTYICTITRSVTGAVSRTISTVTRSVTWAIASFGDNNLISYDNARSCTPGRCAQKANDKNNTSDFTNFFQHFISFSVLDIDSKVDSFYVIQIQFVII
jgi:hypothetical protein